MVILLNRNVPSVKVTTPNNSIVVRTGIRGLQGSQGAQGEQGEQGLQGQQGPQGPAGGAPAGVGTELQRRLDANTLGAVTGSSWDGVTLTLPKTTIDGALSATSVVATGGGIAGLTGTFSQSVSSPLVAVGGTVGMLIVSGALEFNTGVAGSQRDILLRSATLSGPLMSSTNTLQIRNGINAQTLELFRTWTDAANLRSLSIGSDASNIVFTSNRLGTGATTAQGFSFVGGDVTLSSGFGLYHGTTPMRVSLTRSLPAVQNDYVEIGSVTAAAAGAVAFRISAVASQGGISIAKQFLVSNKINSPTGFHKLSPLADTLDYGGIDFSIDFNNTGSGGALRLRRVDALGVAGFVVSIVIESIGQTTGGFTPQTGTGSMAAPTLFFPMNQLISGALQIGIAATPVAKLQVNGIDSGLQAGYSLTNWNGSGGVVPAFFATNNFAGATLPTSEPALILGRQGQGGATFNNYVEFKLGRWENSFPNPRTQLDIALTNVGGVAANVLSILSDARVGIATITPNVSAQLDVVSTTKGFLPPRMTKAQRNAIAAPPDGLMVYQTDNTPGIRVRENGAWVAYTATADA